ncbi:hypothetical protein [uncultured Flavobacterium sp.]|uniref:hypothetical protein n=1 Tax=uncultured Flavobacterium sp. TaxID=165435 RepID=UPI003081F91C
MKNISTLAKRGVYNLLIFLTAVQVSYSLINHIFYGKPKPDIMVVIICLLISAFASSEKQEYSKE